MASTFMTEVDGRLQDRRTGEPVDGRSAALYGQVRSFLDDPAFPCIGARTAVKRSAVCGGVYPELGGNGSVAALHAALETFAADVRACRHSFLTYFAVFETPLVPDEATFEHLLWRQLQALHDFDAERHAWDPAVDSDPASPRFGFSIAGSAWFVVGLNPSSVRRSRRFAYPSLVFNAHSQFEALRAQGRYDPLRAAIRTRDIEFSGSLNPNLADFGTQSDARQYAGRQVAPEWRCPLVVRTGCEIE